MKEKEIISYLHNLALKSKFRSRHAAMILSESGEEISESINVNLKNDFIDIYNPLKTLHAEALAILKCRNRIKKLKNSTLYVVRVSRETGKFTESKPCPMCQRIMKTFGVKEAIYTERDGSLRKLDLHFNLSKKKS